MRIGFLGGRPNDGIVDEAAETRAAVRRLL
jgi:hypothetical protein